MRRTQLDRVNPAIRVLSGIVLSLPLALTVDWVSASVALVFEVLVFLAAGVGLGTLLRRVLPLLVVAPFGAVSMLLYGAPSGRTWWQWGPVEVSDGSAMLALALTLRVFALAMPAIVLLQGIDATRMADGLAQVLRLPSRFVLGSLAGFRMLGLFQEDWRQLGQARRARGLGDAGRLRRWVLMSFSLLVLALRRGGRLATAMEAKGFGGAVERTWARPSRVGWPDAVALLLAVLVGGIAVAAAIHMGTLRTVFS
ncbi:energy-coupling factor transporter transmembrane component T [Luteococcus sediminum]|uniref:energy-coupling factor transporter transmembrane component T family protein n=1 Tax=Luteococcus sp. TaxID=1969402 RepID=UPI003736A8C9